MQASLIRDQIVCARGVDWIFFQVVHASSPSYKRCELKRLLCRKEHCDLALVAITKSSPFWTLFSQTVPVRWWLGHQASGFPRLEWLARTAERFTTTYLGRWSHHWSNSFMAMAQPPLPPAGEHPRILSPELTDEFVQRVSLRTPGPQEIIMVSKDRATLVFSQWESRIRSRSAWHVPFAIAVSVGATLATATFTDLKWCKAGPLQGIFATILIFACGWLVRELYRLCTTRNVSPERFIEELAAGTQASSLEAEAAPQPTVER